MNESCILDPVAAYDRLAAFYPQISRQRERYLHSIERLVASRIPPGSGSLLDVGAGDGSRSARIARLAGLTQVVLLEPSSEMVKGAGNAAEIWPVRAEDLGSANSISERAKSRRFDVIVSLWNVLGHIAGEETRARVLRQLGRMSPANGKLFLDFNHRYNINSYGLAKTGARFLYDHLFPQSANGDVDVAWRIGNGECRTRGHVFTDAEVRKLASAADLVIDERVVVDYDTGRLRRFQYQGNLLYVFRRRSSCRDSVNAPQTSFTSSSVI
jgi:2-polyprenyl-3-methyl-5-hydroxy-6-metoxy-1,4-benzoquinol methylase